MEQPTRNFEHQLVPGSVNTATKDAGSGWSVEFPWVLFVLGVLLGMLVSYAMAVQVCGG